MADKQLWAWNQMVPERIIPLLKGQSVLEVLWMKAEINGVPLDAEWSSHPMTEERSYWVKARWKRPVGWQPEASQP